MPRIKNTARVIHKKAKTALKKTKALITKAAKKSLALKQQLKKDGLIHTGKLKVPFKPATGVDIAKGKNMLMKQLKRRYIMFSDISLYHELYIY